jgi:hypothetical protein
MKEIANSPLSQDRKANLIAPISKKTTQQYPIKQSPYRNQQVVSVEDIVPELRSLRESIGRLQQ